MRECIGHVWSKFEGWLAEKAISLENSIVEKERLERVGRQDDGNCLRTFWIVRPIRPSRYFVFRIPYVEFEC